MYGQANYGSQFGQGSQSQNQLPPAYQQRAVAPPPPPPPTSYFQQGPPIPSHSITQQAPLPPPPTAPPLHLPQSGSLGPPLPLGQGPSIQVPGGISNIRQSYFHTFQSVHGSTQGSQFNSNTQQNMQLSHSGISNLHHISLPPPPPRTLNPDLLRPLQPSTMVPVHPPFQGQLYGTRVHPPIQQGGFQVLPPIPQHPSTSNFPTPPFGVMQSNHGESHLHSRPPPPPSSPPPVPPSPPPPTSDSLSSVSYPYSSNPFRQSDFDPSSGIHSTQESKALESSHQGAMAPGHVGNNAKHDEHGNCVVGSKVDDNILPNKDYTQDLPPSPPEPIVSARSISPADSDMEMEDDITPSIIEEGASQSFDIQSYECKSRDKEHDLKQQLQGPEDLQKCSPAKDKLVEARRVSSPMINISGIAKQPSGSNFEISVTCLPNDESLSVVAAASEAISSTSSQSTSLISGGSPFRLIQDYASDENSENDDESHLKDVNVAVAPSAPASAKTSNGDTDNLTAYLGSRIPCQVQQGFGALGEASMSDTGAKFISESQKQINDSSIAIIRSGMENEQSEKNKRNQVGTSTSSYKSLDATIEDSVDILYESDELPKENDEDKLKLESSPAKIDKFGRLVREGGSDSDSDDSHYTRRRKNRRTRNSSHSHSPVDRRRGRRSPRRRRERRSRSRSWSPRNQRGRSRSPVSRRTSQFNNENMRREKGLMRRCFDFQRGRCYRGASCRYMHYEPSKNDGSRLHRSKQHHDTHPTSKNIKVREETRDMSGEVSDLLLIEVKNQECHNMSSKDDNPDLKTNSVNVDLDSDVIRCQSSRDRADSVQEVERIYSKPAAAHIHMNEGGQGAEKSCHQFSVITVASQCTSTADTEKYSVDISTSILASSKNSVVQQPINSVAELQTADSSSCQMYDYIVSNLSPAQITVLTTSEAPEREPFPDKTSSIQLESDTSSASQLPVPTQFLSPSLVPPAPAHAVGDSYPLHELPPPPPLHELPPPPPLHELPPPPPLVSLVASAEVPMPVPSNFVPQNVSFPSESSLPGSFHPHQGLASIQPSHYHGTSFLLPKTTYDSTSAPVSTKYSAPMYFQQTHLPQGSDLGSQSVVKSQPLELHGHSQVGESPVQEHWRAPMHMDELRSIVPTANFRPSLPFGVPSFQKEENSARSSVELNSSSFFPHGNSNAQSMPFTNESSSNRLQTSGDNFPPSEFQSSFSQFHPYPRFQQPMYAHQPAYDSLLRGPGEVGSISRHFPDPLSRNQSSMADFRGLGIPNYHNPYASTFEKPLSSNFRSNVLKLGNDATTVDVHDSTLSLSSVPVERQGADCVGSRQTTNSPNTMRPLGRVLPSSGGDQYDPLFDSIEPSSPIIKPNLGQKLEKTRESHIITRLSGSHKPLDVEENNKHKEVAPMTSTTSLSLENDEFGETADAEAGAVDNDPIDEALLTGEIEIDQVKSPGKSKTSKGSRSLRLFKIAIADFVKEVLKPSWRQGNMSKEAFKTIVKKTVDKVAGAMKSHQVPKSQAKINRYIDSSQRKLTKLVTGYVDKYVKA